MRIRLFLTLCSTLLILQLKAEDSISDINRSKIDYYFLYTQYVNVFSETPSLLTGWSYDNWSFIGADYEMGKGNFRNPQKFNRLTQINVRTESVYKPAKGKWIFHGKFRYSNGMADSVNANLSYNIENEGSPYYLFQLKPGDWNLQNYEFNVTAANKVTDRISLGFKIMYDGDLAFRISDSRNEQTSLITKAVFSADYKIGDNDVVSLGIDYGRVRTEPNVTNKYHHEATDLTYNRYLNTGLGSYIKSVDFKTTINKQSTGIITQWFHQAENASYTAIYEFFSGEESYLNKKLTNINDQNIILRYKHISNKARLSTLHEVNSKFLSTCLNFNFTKGDGLQWSESSMSYLNNYNIEMMDADFKATLYNPFSYLRRINISANFSDVHKLDKNYGYQFNYTNLAAGLNAELMFRFKYFRTGFMLGALYGKNLDNLNFPNAAASNLYVDWIANPLMSYLSCDFLEIPAYVRFDIPFKNNLVEFMVNAKQQFPLNLNFNAGALFDTSDYFRSYNVSLKFYF